MHFNNNKMIRRGLAALLCLSAASCACAANLDLVYNARDTELQAAPLPGACALNIVGISDQRFNTDSMGADFPLLTSDPIPWISAGLDNLKAYGFTVQKSATPQPQAVNLDVQLIRSYTWFGNMRINATVAVDVGITPVGGARRVQKFRASGSKTNMMGADSEQLTTLNEAFNHMSFKLANALETACAESKAAAK